MNNVLQLSDLLDRYRTHYIWDCVPKIDDTVLEETAAAFLKQRQYYRREYGYIS